MEYVSDFLCETLFVLVLKMTQMLFFIAWLSGLNKFRGGGGPQKWLFGFYSIGEHLHVTSFENATVFNTLKLANKL
jgi:hypothetical protein